MPCAENDFYLQGQFEHVFIGGDVYAYFGRIIRNADAILDGLASPRRWLIDRHQHWCSLMAGGLEMEEVYLGWRASRPAEALAASFSGFQALGYQVEHFITAYSHLLVDSGFDRPTDLGMQLCEQRYGHDLQRSVLLRTARRAYHDFDGYRVDALEVGRAAHGRIEEAITARRHASILELERLLRELPAARPLEVIAAEITEKEYLSTLSLGAAQRYIRRSRKRARSAIVRSIKLVEQLLGPEPVRLFLNGEGIRITGRHAVYELKKGYGLGPTHSADLSVYTKEGDIRLCGLCIHTRGVPLMDHVANMLLYVQADAEEEILNIGNPISVQRAAYDQPWLVPFLPPKERLFPERRASQEVRRSPRSGLPKIPVLAYDARRIELPPEERKLRIDAMNGMLFERLMNDIGKFLPPMEHAEHLLRHGHPAPTDTRHRVTVQVQVDLDEVDDPVAWAEIRAEHRTALHLMLDNPDLYPEAIRQGALQRGGEDHVVAAPGDMRVVDVVM